MNMNHAIPINTQIKYLDVLVIGAGQAGLAVGQQLQKTTLTFQIFERANTIGSAWKKRYNSLSLFTPRGYSALEGLEISGCQDTYPSRNEFIAYLNEYANFFNLPITLNNGVQSLTQNKPGQFIATLDNGDQYSTTAVIIATGAFQKSKLPAFAKTLPSSIIQIIPENYQAPSQVLGETVLIVGDGATGRDLAVELSSTHKVFLSTGKKRYLLPEKLLKKSIWWWLKHLGLLTLSSQSWVGRIMQQKDAFPNRNRNLPFLKMLGVQIVPRVIDTVDDIIMLEDNQTLKVDNIIWCIGYIEDNTWLNIDSAKDINGNFLHQ